MKKNLLQIRLILVITLLLSACSSDQFNTKPKFPDTTVQKDDNQSNGIPGDWSSARSVYQSTQNIRLTIGADYFSSSDVSSGFGIQNTSSVSELVAPSTPLDMGSVTSQGVNYSFNSNYQFELNLYPYAKDFLVTPGINNIAFEWEANRRATLAKDLFEIRDFTTYWYLSRISDISEKSVFWLDGADKPSVAADGSMLMMTGIGSGVLFR